MSNRTAFLSGIPVGSTPGGRATPDGHAGGKINLAINTEMTIGVPTVAANVDPAARKSGLCHFLSRLGTCSQESGSPSKTSKLMMLQRQLNDIFPMAAVCSGPFYMPSYGPMMGVHVSQLIAANAKFLQ